MVDHLRAIVSGAAGFTGAVLCETLRKKNIEVYALVREGSEHNKRLDKEDEGLHVIEGTLGDFEKSELEMACNCDLFFHIAWSGGKTVAEQQQNIVYILDALRTAKKYGCKRFVATGSQAEYGIVSPKEMQTEDMTPNPYTAYGSAKVAACYMSRQLAKELDVEWV